MNFYYISEWDIFDTTLISIDIISKKIGKI